MHVMPPLPRVPGEKRRVLRIQLARPFYFAQIPLSVRGESTHSDAERGSLMVVHRSAAAG